MRRSSRLAQLPGRPNTHSVGRPAAPAPVRSEQTQPSAAAPEKGVPTRELEARLWSCGFKHVAGVDEAGRGPLAGPVVAVACCISQDACIPGVRDSKLMSAAQRQDAYTRLTKHPEVVWATAVVDVPTIDKINILQATLLAMERAVQSLLVAPDFVLVDGNRVPQDLQAQVPCEAVVGGDRHSFVIAAASVIAKVERDLLMESYHKMYPEYGFAQHKGYGTAAHMQAITAQGPCPIHRMSFAPMKHMGA